MIYYQPASPVPHEENDRSSYDGLQRLPLNTVQGDCIMNTSKYKTALNRENALRIVAHAMESREDMPRLHEALALLNIDACIFQRFKDDASLQYESSRRDIVPISPFHPLYTGGEDMYEYPGFPDEATSLFI